MVTLITIPISHCCEKARWALERAGIPYREERHVQGLHRIAVRRAGGGSTVPALVTPGGVLADSADILEWVDEQAPELALFGRDQRERTEIEALCRRFDETLGPHGRRLMYVHMLAAPELALRFNNTGVPRWEDRFLRRAWPLAARYVGRKLGIEPGVQVKDEALVWQELDFAAGLLCDGRDHLCGARLSAADITFAALAGAVIVPPGYGVPLPQPPEQPPQLRALVERAREHPAGRYALELFRSERRPAASAGASERPAAAT